METRHQHHPSSQQTLFPRDNFNSSVAYWAQNNLQLDEARHCLLDHIVHFKCTDGKQHEFYLVHLRHPSAILCFDRSLKVPENTSPATRAISLSLAYSLSRPANDHVFISLNDTEQTIIKRFTASFRLRTLNFPENAPGPSLAQLSILLLIADKYKYRLPTQSCYWYVGVTWEALRVLFPRALVSRDKGTPHPSTWWGIYVPQNIDTREVVLRYKNEWKEFKRRADQKTARRRAEQKKFYKQGVSEEKRRQKEKMRRLQMENEELRRRAGLH